MTRKMNMKNNKLHNIKNTGFKTPDDYFNSFEDKLMQQLRASEGLEDVNTPGFTVPKTYFDTVENDILNKLNNKSTPVIQLTSRRPLYYIAGIAASLLLLLAIFINKTNEEVTTEMVESYFENSDLDSYELAELLVETNILEDDFTITESQYNEAFLETYLLDNADLESILE